MDILYYVAIFFVGGGSPEDISKKFGESRTHLGKMNKKKNTCMHMHYIFVYQNLQHKP